MDIRMKVALSGADYRVEEGQVTDHFDEDKANMFVRVGLAEHATSEAKQPQLDHDGDGREGGGKAEDTLVVEIDGNALFRMGGGWHRMAGPLFPEEVRIRGAVAARETYDARLAEAGNA